MNISTRTFTALCLKRLITITGIRRKRGTIRKKIGVTPTTDQAGGGHAHCGMMIYLGDNWPQKYRGKLFTCNLHGLRINSDRLERNGATYIGKHEPDFLPHDGSLVPRDRAMLRGRRRCIRCGLVGHRASVMKMTGFIGRRGGSLR